MPTIKLDDQFLFFTKKAGNPGLPVVVLLHGAGSSHLSWPPGLRRLSDFAVLAVDLPGHGRSHPPGRSSIDDYAADIANLLNQQKIEQAILIGHSMGGAIAQTLALSQPDLITGLVLIGTGAKLPVSDLILEQTLTDFDTVTNFVTRYSWAPGTPPPLVAKAHDVLVNTPPAVLHGDFAACNNFDVRGQLEKISVPTLVIAGSIDKMVPAKFGRYLAEQIPNATLHTIEAGGHMMMLEQAGEVTAVITQFLAQNFL